MTSIVLLRTDLLFSIKIRFKTDIIAIVIIGASSTRGLVWQLFSSKGMMEVGSASNKVVVEVEAATFFNCW